MQRSVVRAYSFYVAMFIILGGGLWTILNLGSALHAPQDISGEWNVRWTTPPPPGAGAAPSKMRIEQSGRFCRVIFDELRLSLKLAGGTALHQGAVRQPLAEMTGEGWSLTLRPLDGADVLRIELNGPQRYQADATRDANQQIEASAGAEQTEVAVDPH